MQPYDLLPDTVLLQFRRDTFRQLQKIAREQGDIVYLRLGREKVLLVHDPDLNRDVLVTHHRNFTKGHGLERIKKFVMHARRISSACWWIIRMG